MSAITDICESIRRVTAKRGGKPPPVCYVSDEEWDGVAAEHIGGPWLAKMTVMDVPLKRLSEIIP